MPAALLPRSAILARLSETFRRQGYDGASLAEIAKATGLGKSSLYHYFPGGKSEMAAAVLADLAESLEVGILAPLRGTGTPARRLGRMIDALDEFYDGGRKACLLERLAASVERATFARPLQAVFRQWIDAVAALLREAGLSPAAARVRAEDSVIRIEGALVLSGGTGSTKPFERVLTSLRGDLLPR
jgi:AcrR family transcriptional regulator